MTAIQHVFKRGSVYWWRRRLPIGTSRCDWVRLELSLNTKEARGLLENRRDALIAIAERLKNVGAMTGEEVDALLVAHDSPPI